jgi:hypothetical protein
MLLGVIPGGSDLPDDSVMTAPLIDRSIPVDIVVRSASIGSQVMVLPVHAEIVDGDILLLIAP